jgi:hypothetical protein
MNESIDNSAELLAIDWLEQDSNDTSGIDYLGVDAGGMDFYEINGSSSRKGGGERSNAKPVECLDLEGNLVEIFKSGLAASQKLNITQGDISLCCR